MCKRFKKKAPLILRAAYGLASLDSFMKFHRLNFFWTGYAVNLYGAYQADAFALKGSVGWLAAKTEADRDLDADVLHAGLRAEYGIPVAGMTVSPFMGARVMSGSFDGLDSQTVFLVPLGARLSGTLEAGDWRVKPLLEAAYVRSFGDTADGETGSDDWRSNSLNLKLGIAF